MAEDCERTLLRRELIRELCEGERSISELSKLYGLSRKTILSEELSGYNIGLKPMASGKFEIFWGQLLVGLLEPAAADPIRLARRKKTPSRRHNIL